MIVAGTLYYRPTNFGLEFYQVTRSTERNVWLKRVGHRISATSNQLNGSEPIQVTLNQNGPEIRKGIGKDGLFLSGGFSACEGVPRRWSYEVVGYDER